jgi:phage baseplate assembly protein W
MTNNDYIGVAMSRPVTIDGGTVSGIANIEQSIMDILNTPQGTRLFLPEYGSRIKKLLFEPNDSALKALLALTIQEAIEAWETRVSFEDVTFQQSESSIECSITVKVLQSNEIHSFVYPFYPQNPY